MTTSPPPVPATLALHEGELVDRGHGVVLWLGDLTPSLLADLMREGASGPLRMQPEGSDPRDVWIRQCWYDVEHKRMAVELRERGTPS